ncbi:hypothetical protein AAMO2058_000970900 [Amorphochlora amoebiformis]
MNVIPSKGKLYERRENYGNEDDYTIKIEKSIEVRQHHSLCKRSPMMDFMESYQALENQLLSTITTLVSKKNLFLTDELKIYNGILGQYFRSCNQICDHEQQSKEMNLEEKGSTGKPDAQKPIPWIFAGHVDMAKLEEGMSPVVNGPHSRPPPTPPSGPLPAPMAAKNVVV